MRHIVEILILVSTINAIFSSPSFLPEITDQQCKAVASDLGTSAALVVLHGKGCKCCYDEKRNPPVTRAPPPKCPECPPSPPPCPPPQKCPPSPPPCPPPPPKCQECPPIPKCPPVPKCPPPPKCPPVPKCPPPCPTTTTTTIPSTSETSSAAPPTTPRYEKCPPSTNGERWLLANEHDCHKYWYCQDGKQSPGVCGPGLLFDEELLLCDLEKLVDCGPRKK